MSSRTLLTPQERQWLETLAAHPDRLHRQIRTLRILIVVEALLVIAATLFLASCRTGQWWIVTGLAILLLSGCWQFGYSRRMLKRVQEFSRESKGEDN